MKLLGSAVLFSVLLQAMVRYIRGGVGRGPDGVAVLGLGGEPNASFALMSVVR